MHAAISSENDPPQLLAVGSNGCGPEDHVAVTESVLAVASVGTSRPAPIPGRRVGLPNPAKRHCYSGGGNMFVLLRPGTKRDDESCTM